MEINMICAHCSAAFIFDSETFKALGLANIPKRCPTCADRRQHRPDKAIIVTRECVAEFDPVRILLPDLDFEEYRAAEKDRPCLRAIIRGGDLGAGVSWEGRVDIYILATSLPDVGRVRIMQASHAEETAGYNDPYEYVVIEPTDCTTEGIEPGNLLTLGLAKVDYKTTLKGYGRQFHAALDTAQAAWAKELSCRCRSGRYGTKGAIYVTSPDYPVTTKQWGDIESEQSWPTL